MVTEHGQLPILLYDNSIKKKSFSSKMVKFLIKKKLQKVTSFFMYIFAYLQIPL